MQNICDSTHFVKEVKLTIYQIAMAVLLRSNATRDTYLCKLCKNYAISVGENIFHYCQAYEGRFACLIFTSNEVFS